MHCRCHESKAPALFLYWVCTSIFDISIVSCFGLVSSHIADAKKQVSRVVLIFGMYVIG